MTEISNIVSYLNETLGLKVKIESLKGRKEFFLFLYDLYDFYSVVILGRKFILALSREKEESAGVIRKHIEHIQSKTNLSCLYARFNISSYNCKRLIAQGVQFIVPGKRIYLPLLGIDWMERSRMFQESRQILKKISPSAQAIVIFALVYPNEKKISLLETSKKMSYSSMTITRAFNELEYFELGKTFKNGTERNLNFRKSLWEYSKTILRSPIKKKLWIQLTHEGESVVRERGASAGMSALSEMTFITSPKLPVYAISSSNWKAIRKDKFFKELPSDEEADIELEIWSYDPKLFAKKGIVDQFSLYLSLKNEQDERVAAALEKLMENLQ